MLRFIQLLIPTENERMWQKVRILIRKIRENNILFQVEGSSVVLVQLFLCIINSCGPLYRDIQVSKEPQREGSELSS